MNGSYDQSSFRNIEPRPWSHRRLITLDNDGGGDKREWPVKITLTDANFDFSKSDGTDLQFRAVDGVRILPHWVQEWDAGSETATVWVRLPGVAAGAKAFAYVYYGNAKARDTSSIAAVFPYGEDFAVLGTHPTLSSDTVVLTETEDWEGTPPHTLSVVDMGEGAAGGRYWGYYGLQGVGAIGLARSDNLTNWTKVAEPVIDLTAGRWPSVIKAPDGTLHMAVNVTGVGGVRTIEHYSSGDGLAWTHEGRLAINVGDSSEPTNPYLARFGGTYYLYQAFQVSSGTNEIRVRKATTVAGLLYAEDRTLLVAEEVLAAPAILYFDGRYWLYAEVFAAGGNWGTVVYVGDSPEGPWAPAVNSELLGQGDACPFPFVDDEGVLHLFLCHLQGGTWDLRVRTSDTAEPSLSLPSSVQWPWQANVVSAEIALDGETTALHFDNGQETRSGTRLGSLNRADFQLEALVKLTDTSVILGFRRDATSGRGYCLTLTASAYSLDFTTEDGWDGDLSETNVTGGSHEVSWSGYALVTVTVVGDSITVALDGEQLFTTTDSNVTAAGLFTLEADAGEAVYVSRLYIRPHDGTDPSVTLGGEESPALPDGEFPAGPAGSWAFTDGAGTTAVDGSGNDLDLTFNAEPEWSDEGARLQSLYAMSGETGQAIASDYTFVFTVRNASAQVNNGAVLTAASSSSNSRYEGVYTHHLGKLMLLTRGTSQSTSASFITVSPYAFVPLAFQSVSGVLRLVRLDTGEAVTVESQDPQGNIRIGFGVLARQTPVDANTDATFAYAAYYDSALTEAQLKDAYEAMQAALLPRGVVI